MQASLWVAVMLLVLSTVLPICRFEAWWVRGLDFPRLQLAVLGLVLIPLELWLLEYSAPSTWVMFSLTLACLLYHAWWIIPYTRLFPKEVKAGQASDDGKRLSVLTANVLTPNRDAPKLLALVREHQPDILVTLETDDWWQQQLDQLAPEYPYSIRCPLDNLYGMLVYSRLPLENPGVQFLVEDDVPSMHAEVVLRSGDRVGIHCLHPAPPSPTENETSSERDAELIVVGRSIADSRAPVVVTGDLNDVAWSRTTRLFRKISGLLDPRIGRGMFNSFHANYPLIRWPLDHFFHSQHFVLESLHRLPAFGSDHFPVLIRLAYHGNRVEQEGLEPDSEDWEDAQEKMADESVRPGDVHRPERSGG